ncbi:autotransporter family protein [Budvicia aquatica]|uniref:autotransporter family protein n=1 Tax=Budvicia aquatica TaxID=82979 RepID=UPI00207E47AE|nr:autotransporter outer membrane beta-barrel domain-containing protein [Budvicia aquatica]GKX49886.1 autotransporter [Budvicia aquatica]
MNIKDKLIPDMYRGVVMCGTSLALLLLPVHALADLTINNSEKFVGEGQVLDTAGDLYVGRNRGNGTPGVLTIVNGGRVDSRLGYVGYINGSKGITTVTGENSQWINTSELSVGFQSEGKLTIADGAKVSNTVGYIGHQAATGEVLVTGSHSLWQNTGDLTIAHTDSSGVLLIENGATVTSVSGHIAKFNSTASAIVTGSDSQWINSGNVFIAEGSNSKGSLILTDSGSVTASTISVGTNGSIIIGGTDTADKPGFIHANTINLGANNSSLNFNHTSDNYLFTPGLSGAGIVDITSGNTTLSGLNTYWGPTFIHSGAVLEAASDGALSLNSKYTLAQDSILRLGGTRQTIATLSNSGVMVMNNSPSTSGASLTIIGDYIGNNGHIIFNSLLGGDNSVTDFMMVKGNTSGITNISVIHAGGLGADTIEGIKLIDVRGNSDGEFVQNGRIVAGSYEYYLHNNVDGGWYLRSERTVLPEPEKPEKPEKPNENGNNNGNNRKPSGHIQRPESGSYMANMAIASKLFNQRLEDRNGRAENSSLWLRQSGAHTRFRDGSAQLHNQTNRYVVQGGGEALTTHFSDADSLGLGTMFGYGTATTHTDSVRSSYSSKAQVDGYSAGLYATWYQNANTHNGLYIDSWVNYSWLHARVNGDGLSGERYNINGFSASFESGYKLSLRQNESSQIAITPQAQIIWNGLRADNHTELNGTRVQSDGSNNIQTRLGVKLSRNRISGLNMPFSVYTEANWMNNSKLIGSTLDSIKTHQAGSQNLAELKLGTQGQVANNTFLWTSVAQQLGNYSYSDTLVNLGLKYQF